jgi:hypothetical protein
MGFLRAYIQLKTTNIIRTTVNDDPKVLAPEGGGVGVGEVGGGVGVGVGGGVEVEMDGGEVGISKSTHVKFPSLM